jgi:hypothetical protein
MKYLFAITSACILMLFSTCGNRDQQTDSVSLPDQQIEHFELTIVDSIGIETGDSNYVFGTVQALTHGPDGFIYVLDRVYSCIKVFSPSGEFVRKISGWGNGPGEIVNPIAMAVTGNGKIFISSPGGGLINCFLPTGEWESISAEFNYGVPMTMIGVDSNAYIGLRLSVEPVEENLTCIFSVARYDGSADPEVLYYKDSFPFETNDLTTTLRKSIFGYTCAADRNGNIYFAPLSSEEYHIVVFSPEGDTLLEISRDVERIAKSEEEIRSEKEWVETLFGGEGAGSQIVEYNPDPYRDMIADIGVDSEERIWVRRGTVLSPVFDVYDSNGELLFYVEIPSIGNEAQFWDFVIDEYGMLAYPKNPEYYQKIYLLELSGTID